MIKVLTFALLVVAASAQLRGGVAPVEEPEPEPYAFNFAASTDDGAVSTREETGTKEGVVTGFYTIDLPDGQKRRVDYIADKDGFRVRMSTNEVGTSSLPINPADVELDANPLKGPEISELPKRPAAPINAIPPRTPPPTTRRPAPPAPKPTNPPGSRTIIGDDGLEYVIVPVRRGETLREAVENLPGGNLPANSDNRPSYARPSSSIFNTKL